MSDIPHDSPQGSSDTDNLRILERALDDASIQIGTSVELDKLPCRSALIDGEISATAGPCTKATAKL
jgi:hypothetical protein